MPQPFNTCVRDSEGYAGICDAAYLESIAGTIETLYEDYKDPGERGYLKRLVDEYLSHRKEYLKRCKRMTKEMRGFLLSQRTTTRFEEKDALKAASREAKAACDRLFPGELGAKMVADHFRKKGIEFEGEPSAEAYEDTYEWGSDLFVDDARDACEFAANKVIKTVNTCMREREKGR